MPTFAPPPPPPPPPLPPHPVPNRVYLLGLADLRQILWTVSTSHLALTLLPFQLSKPASKLSGPLPQIPSPSPSPSPSPKACSQATTELTKRWLLAIIICLFRSARAVFKYDDNAIVHAASGTDYEEFRGLFEGWYNLFY